MPTLLYLLFPGRDESDMIWPAQQSPTLRATLDRHADECPRCVLRWGTIWDTPVRKATFAPRCDVGGMLARNVLADANQPL
jgi:hypothetical protein